jgi:2-oxoglutarate ferredoxin oxidoreductase subunit gamma
MHAEIIIAGSGGQGVLVIGRLLAEAGFLEGREVVWSPSYGAEKRGGSVSCSVTISDEKIGALVITCPTIGIAMNYAAAVKLEQIVKTGGWLVVNQTEAVYKTTRRDIQQISVPANRLALEIGVESAANIIVLGALIEINPVVSSGGIIKVMEQLFGSNPKALEMNKQALIKGSTGIINVVC